MLQPYSKMDLLKHFPHQSTHNTKRKQVFRQFCKCIYEKNVIPYLHKYSVSLLFGILLGSALAVAKAAATLPGVQK